MAGSGVTRTNNEGRFFDQLVQGGRAEIQPNSLLYEVFGKDTALPEEEYTKIGEIWTKDEYFTQSLWGDERLFFQHGGLNLDLQHLPEGFRRTAGVRTHSPELDLEKYGDWNNPSTFDPPEASEADIINGMVQSGCPFSYLIDYINTLGDLDPAFVRPVNPAAGS